MNLRSPDRAALLGPARHPTATVTELRRSMGVETATRRWLMGVVMPLWLGAGLLDWRCHRRTHIETTAGARESAIHSLMLAEAGAPVMLGLFCEVNAGVLATCRGALGAHGATAYWDVTYAEERRRVTPGDPGRRGPRRPARRLSGQPAGASVQTFGGAALTSARADLSSRSSARSPSDKIPMACPSSTTGMRRTAFSRISRTAAPVDSSGPTVTSRSVQMAPSVVVAGLLFSAMARTTMSRSVTSPRSVLSSCTRTVPMPWSRILLAASVKGVSAGNATGAGVMTSRALCAMDRLSFRLPSRLLIGGPTPARRPQSRR
jgi:hypothetical protein